MSDQQQSPKFWLGNAILAIAMVMLLFLGRLWEIMGAGAMFLWIVTVGIGVFLLMQGKDGGAGNYPD